MMMFAAGQKVARLQDLLEGKGKLVCVDGEEIALFKIEGKIFAVGNVCPHQHFSKLHEGILNGKTLTCPMHGWSYDVESGKAVNADGRLKTFVVDIRGEDVFLLSEWTPLENNGNVDAKNKSESV
ncbi:MAG: Rieske 2Fe-2S domain-containing protein [Bacteroidota bacterium]|nr:Rieske 2Fe-2S domain-containing protein [Bacteroidota bacterium]